MVSIVRRLVFLFLFLIPMQAYPAAEVDKNLIYFRLHPEAAKKMLESDYCKSYSIDDVSDHSYLFARKKECDAAITATKELDALQKNFELIDKLTKIKDNLGNFSSTRSDKNKIRYLEYKETFEKSTEDAEKFVISCINDFERVKQNGVGCLAATDVMLDKLQKWRDSEEERFRNEAEFEDNYKKYLRDHDDKVAELMQGKCKELVSNSWYKYDDKIQDKECNLVLLANERLESLKRLFDIESNYKGISSEKHTIKYYRKNISEAEKVQKDCRSGHWNGELCGFVEAVLGNKKKNDDRKKVYLEEYKKDMSRAWQTVDDCRYGREKDEIKCDTAQSLVREILLKRKESGQLKKYIEHYKENQKEAYKILRGQCMSVPDDDKFFEIDLQCEAALKATSQNNLDKGSQSLAVELGKIRANIISLVNNSEYKKNLRYSEAYQYFKENEEEAQGYVESCLDIDFARENGMGCLASIDIVQARLDKILAKNDAGKQVEKKYLEHYSNYFKKNPEKLQETLQGKCKELMIDPWYEYDPEIQDMECNIAMEIKKEAELKSKEVPIATASEKSFSYYLNNIDESERLYIECNKLKNKNKSCEYAAAAIAKKKENEDKKNSYLNLYKKDIKSTWNIIEKCRNGEEKDGLKCDAVADIVKDRIKARREGGELAKYMEYYKHHPEEANSLVQGACMNFIEDEDGFEPDVKCEAAIKANSENLIAISNKELAEKLAKIKDNIADIISNKNYEKDPRYQESYTYFKDRKREAEDYITSCLDIEKAKRNGLGCLAAVDVISVELKKKLAINEDRKKIEEKYNENYKKLFENNPEKIEEVLAGKCREIFLDPWYQYDKSSQDMECNVALEVKKNIEMKAAPVIVATASEKSMDYYFNNIDEAKKIAIDCKHHKKKDKNCEYAGDALRKKDVTDKKKAEYKKIYETDNHLAWTTLDNCKKGNEKDELKCESIEDFSRERSRQKKENNELTKYIEYFKAHQEEGRVLLAGDCSDFVSNDNVFEIDMKCEAVMKALGESRMSLDTKELVEHLEKIKSNISELINNKKYEDDQRYKEYYSSFDGDNKEAEAYVKSCLDITHAKQNGLSCLAAINIVEIPLKKTLDNGSAAKMTEEKYREHYRKYFVKNPDKMEDSLNGKCREFFLDPWYKYDPEMQEIECNVAIEMKKKEKLKNTKIVEDVSHEKNIEYYKNNIVEAKQLDADCRSGKVESISHCQYAIIAYQLVDSEEKKRSEYEEFYKTHVLAAKYYVKWCKGAMLKFDTRCTIADNAVKNHKPNIIDEEKKKQYYDNFKSHPADAKSVLDGRCKDKIADVWYFLDKELQDEECDAAAEAMMDRY